MQTRRQFLRRAGFGLGGLAAFPWLTGKARCADQGVLDRQLASLHVDLQAFEDDFLPALLAPRFLDHGDGPPRLLEADEVRGAYGPGPILDGLRRRDASLSRWRAAARSLREAVPYRAGVAACPLPSSEVWDLFTTTNPEFSELLDTPPAPLFTFVDGRPRWEVCPYRVFGEGNLSDQARRVLPRLQVANSNAANPWAEIGREMPRLRQWLLGLHPLGNENLAALPGVVPLLAAVDPSLAVAALDRGRMRAAVASWPGVRPQETAMDLRETDNPFFTGCLCCALALTLQTLANGRLENARPLLRQPELYADAFWLGMATKMVFAVFWHKALALRALAVPPVA